MCFIFVELNNFKIRQIYNCCAGGAVPAGCGNHHFGKVNIYSQDL